MASTITLTGDYGYEAFRYNGGDAVAIDATEATWIVDNEGSQTNLYPFLVDNANAGIDIYGATINGNVSLTGEWLDLYVNSAAFMVRDTEQARISDIRITQAWDALRIAGNSDGFEISNVWVTDVRDDAFENDNPVSGAIRNSLFDGVFSGISLGHKNMADASHEVLEIDGLLMRMESYLFKGQMTHQSPFKMESKSPQLSITDSVIAIDNVNHIGDSRLQLAWDKTIHSSNNVFLNLSDDPLPSDYPMPPSGWTVLEGQEARDYWDAAQADWIASHDGDALPDEGGNQPDESDALEPEAPQPDPEPDQDPAAETPVTGDNGSLADGVSLSLAGKIVLDNTVFTSLETGPDGEARTLDAAHFEVAARADDIDDYIMYKWKTGELFYDADGRGSAKQVKIGQFDRRLDLDHTDFVVVGEQAPTVDSDGTWNGEDIIAFDAVPADGSFQEISGFAPGSDKFVFDSSAFTALQDQQGEMLDEAHFEIAARADDIDDYVIYKWKTGELFYDADGSGGSDQVKIAQLDAQMALDHSDFLVL
ncbi:hypothetical protein [Leisingera sp. ANG59]|uniref:hypothetical protein n=1 Tax=Leisingera sp. ANG59 TaxID=2675221 RepID=UPI001571F1D7|nr:hypothetical protein [Leisingera sp. ANG59]NSY39569.1 hypothetical protein [Leisingera sp. ANG59]